MRVNIFQEPGSSDYVQGFDSLRVLNLEENCFGAWNEILKLSHLKSLEQLHLSKNQLEYITYPDYVRCDDLINDSELQGASFRPFENLRCLLLGGNMIADLASVDSLNSFPNLVAPLCVEGWDEALHKIGRLSYEIVLSSQNAEALLKSVEDLPVLVVAGAEDKLISLKSA